LAKTAQPHGIAASGGSTSDKAELGRDAGAARQQLDLKELRHELRVARERLQAANEKLGRANADIANLMESTRTAAMFLDRDLNVQKFTAAAREQFALDDSDTGRPVADVQARFDRQALQENAAQVLRRGVTLERRVEATDGTVGYDIRMTPYRTLEGAIDGVVVTFADVVEPGGDRARIDELTRELHKSAESLETLLDMIPFGVLILENDRRGEMRVNRYAAHLLGGHAAAEGPFLTRRGVRLFEDGRELDPNEHPLEIANRPGRAASHFDGQLLRPDGEWRDIMITSTPLFDELGMVRGSIAAIVDRTDAKYAEVRQQVLLHELQHRVQNIIATISALAIRTLRAEGAMAPAAEAFQGRLRGLSATHELLMRANWRGASLGDLVAAALRTHTSLDGERVTIEGPKVVMTANAAATLGMVFYELAANAIAYGALAEPTGRVDVSWQIVGPPAAGSVELVWEEIGGPRASTVPVAGFGMTFARRTLEYQLQGMAEMERHRTGIRWKVSFPVAQNIQRILGLRTRCFTLDLGSFWALPCRDAGGCGPDAPVWEEVRHPDMAC
jgi:two-component system CheB/CheR fusion protein